jgi:hypothetical protein
VNLRKLREKIRFDISQLGREELGYPEWFPSSRINPKTGFNGDRIDDHMFHVRVHAYKEGAREVDISSASCKALFLLHYDDLYMWQAVEINNPKSDGWFSQSTYSDLETWWERFYFSPTLRQKRLPTGFENVQLALFKAGANAVN